ncbi:hypothetical protein Zmor_010143 [Zophobas morio]|uniref:Lipase n=1 Tax=Zophobas morio TaxID=2755281 RepID=A0AA38IMR7_9CUCU|nr:hypothetical protein Zmor_010143 [Zophobas morio]
MHLSLSIILLLNCTIAILPFEYSVQYDEQDAFLTVPEIISKYGYPVEEHYVTTPDGYILKLHRIPHGANSVLPAKPVLVMHGLLCSSADWIITGPNHGLGYFLADRGYDVWLGNARGNKFSRNHTTLNPDANPEFWKFSFHEIGTIDVPAMIDYILGVTKQRQLFHVGYSQGTTSFYIMTSMRPEYNKKVRVHVSLAPVAYMAFVKSPILRFLAHWFPVEKLFEAIGFHEFNPSNEFLKKIADKYCKKDESIQNLCANVLFALCGYSPAEMNTTLIPVIFAHTPAGASVQQIMHYAQLVRTGQFQQYDFGIDNLGIYGSLFPPLYEIKHIETPIYLVYSHNDWLAASEGVFTLCKHLGDNCKQKLKVSDNLFNHIDYMYGTRAPEVVYAKVTNIMAHY